MPIPVLDSYWECQVNSDTFLFLALHLLVEVILTLPIVPIIQLKETEAQGAPERKE